jgi:hypothetical protein
MDVREALFTLFFEPGKVVLLLMSYISQTRNRKNRTAMMRNILFDRVMVQRKCAPMDWTIKKGPEPLLVYFSLLITSVNASG